MIINRRLIFIVLLASSFSFYSVVLAASVTLPNPLCLSGSNPNCADGAWVGPYPSEEACNEAYGNSCINSAAGLLGKIASFVLSIVGALAVIMFIWAGILFLTSAGDPSKTTKARHAVIYAIIGIAIVLAGNGLMMVVQAVINGS